MLVEPAVDFWGYVRMTFHKLLFFITPWLPHYSAAHTVVNLLFFLPAIRTVDRGDLEPAPPAAVATTRGRRARTVRADGGGVPRDHC